MNFKTCFVLLFLVITSAALHADGMQSGHKVVTAESLQWNDAKGIPNAKIAVIDGDPSKEGLFTIRLSVPAGLKVPPHWHPTDEHVTVLSGALHMGMGDVFDANKGTAVPAGGYSMMPAKVHHYAWFEGPTIIQITGIGPWQVIYVNPADDPAAKKE